MSTAIPASSSRIPAIGMPGSQLREPTGAIHLLQATGLACQRGERRLFIGLNLGLGAGHLLRVEGANGAGKTSLLRTLAGLSQPLRGSVTWQGLPIARQRLAYAQTVLYLGHMPALKDELNAVENLRADARLQALPRQAEGLLAPALRRLGVAGRQCRLPVRLLSAGQQRRASLARLLLGRVPLWIVDEPYTALDTEGIAVLGEMLAQHLAGGGLAVVTTHQDAAIATPRVQCLRLGA